jgi:hypothetical protein
VSLKNNIKKCQNNKDMTMGVSRYVRTEKVYCFGGPGNAIGDVNKAIAVAIGEAKARGVDTSTDDWADIHADENGHLIRFRVEEP